LLLQPRKIRKKNISKRRAYTSFKQRQFVFGDAGLQILQPFAIPAKRIFKLKLSLKRAVKRSEHTRRLIWFNLFPHLPLSRKAKGLRMGKGTGKLATWFVQLRSGVVLMEFKNLRIGRANHFLKQVAFRLPVQSVVQMQYMKTLSLPGLKKVTGTAHFFFD